LHLPHSRFRVRQAFPRFFGLRLLQSLDAVALSSTLTEDDVCKRTVMIVNAIEAVVRSRCATCAPSFVRALQRLSCWVCAQSDAASRNGSASLKPWVNSMAEGGVTVCCPASPPTRACGGWGNDAIAYVFVGAPPLTLRFARSAADGARWHGTRSPCSGDDRRVDHSAPQGPSRRAGGGGAVHSGERRAATPCDVVWPSCGRRYASHDCRLMMLLF
jgi:hypothetical protein